jgi:hypothetical protein
VAENITGPTGFSKTLIQADGRIKKIPNGNSWKEFRLFRNNQDVGALWDVRETFYVRDCNEKHSSDGD